MRRDIRRRAARAVSNRRVQDQLSLRADPHTCDADVPSLDDLASAEFERDARRPALVEDLLVGAQAADLRDSDTLALGRDWAVGAAYGLGQVAHLSIGKRDETAAGRRRRWR